MFSRVHFGHLSRDAVFGSRTFQLPPMDDVPTDKIINEVRDSLYCQKMNSRDVDFHATVLIKLLDDAVLASSSSKTRTRRPVAKKLKARKSMGSTGEDSVC